MTTENERDVVERLHTMLRVVLDSLILFARSEGPAQPGSLIDDARTLLRETSRTALAASAAQPAEITRLRAEVAALRVSLGQMPAREGCEPIGCPMPGACSAASSAQPGVSGGEALREALQEQIHWHERQRKALSKQPNADHWMMGQHQEQIDAITELLATPPVETTSGATPLGRYGHHPDAPIDFCIEVQRLEGELFEIERGIRPAGTIAADFQRAMDFRVGGDEGCVSAKAALRQLEPRIKALKCPDTTPAASGQAVAQEHRFYAPDENTKDAPLGSVVSFVHGPDPLNVFAMLKVRGHEQSKMIDAWAAYPREMQAYAKRCLKRATHPAPSAASVRAEALEEAARLCETHAEATRSNAKGTKHFLLPKMHEGHRNGLAYAAAIRALQTPHASREGRADG